MAREGAAAADAVMVVILPDGGRSYLSKLYNDEWMRVNGLLATTGAVGSGRRSSWRSAITTAISGRGPGPDHGPGRARRSTSLQRFGISQLPVSQDADGDALGGIVGLGQRAGAPRSRLSQPGDRRPHDRRGHGPPAADVIDGRCLGRRGVRGSSPAAVRRRSRSATGDPRASSPSSTSSSTWPTTGADPGRGGRARRCARSGGAMMRPMRSDDLASDLAFETLAVHAGAEPDA